MAGKVLNIKVCSPFKLRSGLTGKCHENCHYSYNLPLTFIVERTQTGKQCYLKIKILSETNQMEQTII